MANEVFVGSHEKTFPGKGKGYGQNGDPTASSVLPGKDQPIIPNVAPPNASADAGDWQTRKVSVEPIKTHDGMRNRSTERETVPAATIRRDSGKHLLK